MRTLPPYLNHNIKSSAEKLLFEAIRIADFPSDYTCLHSVNLPEHQYKVSGELDFVIVSPRGLYVIEAKGGGVSCTDGIWHYIDRWDRSHKNSEGPFNQASSGMYSLRDRLHKQFTEDELNNLTMGYGVAFPQCDFAQASTEWDPVWILDAHRLDTDGIVNYIKALESHWHMKFAEKPPRVDSTFVKRLIQTLRPNFEMALSLHIQAAQIDANLSTLTENQYESLDAIEDCDRILIEGGAGTGKTFVAVEMARRHAARDQKVLLICFSPVLAAYLKQLVSAPNLTITSVHQMMMHYVKKYGSVPSGFSPAKPITDAWYIDVLTPAFENATRNIEDEDIFDVLIIDEGQDILNLHYVTAMENILHGGFSEGVWRIFYDPFNQSAIYGKIDFDVVALLKEYGPIPPKLKRNCRNTDPIVTMTKLLTGADLKTRGENPGPDVRIIYYADLEDQVSLLEAFLGELKTKDIEDGEITILSSKEYEASCVSKLSLKWRQKILPIRNHSANTFPSTKITFSSIANFKGLENRFIALVDIDDLGSTPNATANLYVGMSRARVVLWMAIQNGLKTYMTELVQRNTQKLGGNQIGGN